MKTLIDKLERALAPPREYKHDAGTDVADSIALVIIVVLICLLLF